MLIAWNHSFHLHSSLCHTDAIFCLHVGRWVHLL